MMGNGYGMGWAMWLLMGGAALAFWIVVVLLVRSLLPSRRTQGPIDSRPDPLTLLKEGLARGELSLEEFEQRRRLIAETH